MTAQLTQHPASFATDIPVANGKLAIIQPIVFTSQEDLCTELINLLQWRQDIIKVHGSKVPIPRLQAWYGEAHCQYSYSGLAMEPLDLPPMLTALKNIAEQVTAAKFNCVLCNLYRDGKDSVAWHADDEAELGRNPTIASYSFGWPRRFLIKPKRGKSRATAITLPDNSLLVMSGEMQHHWLHQLPKTRQPVRARVNLTFRYIQKSEC